MKINQILLAICILLVAGINRLDAQGCAPAPSADDDGAKIIGFIQPQFEVKQLEDGGMSSSFTFNRARIGITGNIPYDVQYYAIVEASQFKKGPFLLDAFVSYTRFPFAKISVGQFKSPFTLEMSRPCNALHTIYRATIVNTLVAPDRDLGLMVSGSLFADKLSYAFALTNGVGLRNIFDTEDTGYDNNHGKTFHSRVQVSPLGFLKVGGGVQYGTHKSIVEDSDKEDSRFRWAVDLQTKFVVFNRDFEVIGEYVAGADKGSYVAGGGGCGGDPVIVEGDLNRNGYYVTAMYKILDNLQPLFRFESYNYDPTSSKGVDYTMIGGLNYWLNDNTRIQANYFYRAEKRLEKPNDEFTIQFQAIF
ncbi:MAG TPA: porin [Saprospiraceae bacterium]|nr:porin [Saprospiraceae bacterium]